VRWLGRGGADLALAVEGQKGNLGWMNAAADRHVVDLTHRQLAGFLGAAPGPHRFHDEQAAADADDLLADAGGAGGPGGVIDIETMTDQRRIADAARQLVRQARGAANAAELALLIQGENGDGVVTVRRRARRKLAAWRGVAAW